MLNKLGIETQLQLAITICVVALVIVTTLGGSGGAPWAFLTYRTLLVVIAFLSAIGSRQADVRTSRVFLELTGVLFGLMLISVLRIPGSHFEGFYLWSKYAFFAAALINLGNYARYQSARWRALILASVVVVNLAHLLPELVARRDVVKGFSTNNANYFATFLLIGFAASVAMAVFSLVPEWRIAAAFTGAILLFGIVKTSSRGATLAVVAMITVAAIRARGRIPRQVWLALGLAGLVAALLTSPYLIQKFFDRGDVDPYNYARKEIWLSSVHVIEQYPLLGTGFGQFIYISKRFTLPIDSTVARYLKRAQMAHNEYLQHIAEIGFPAALLLFALLGYLIYLAFKRGKTAWPEFRGFHEAALLTAIGVGTHALVDNCWTIPVTASTFVVFALADPIPFTKRERFYHWTSAKTAIVCVAVAIVWTVAILIPGIALHYNEAGHQAYDRDDFVAAKRYHLAGLAIVPNHPLFLDNLGMVYLQEFTETKNPDLLKTAKQYFQRAIDASPQSLDPLVHMEAVLVRSLNGMPEHDFQINQEIIRNNTALLNVDPFIPFVRKNLAASYYSIGQVDRALAEMNKAIDYEPNFVPAYLQVADWYRDRGDTDSSRKYTAAAMVIVNKYRNFKATEAYEHVLLGRPEQAWARADIKR